MKSSGRILGGILLVAGCSIGAGMLALPILTGLAGFFPALILLVIAWGYMTYTGLLLVDVGAKYPTGTNLVSMAYDSFGKTGRSVTWVSYLFLFYSLLTAYIAASGSIFASFSALSPATSSLLFTVLLGLVIVLGTKTVDWVNRLLMVGLIVTYLGMVGLGVSHIHPSYLLHFEACHILLPLPVLIVSFGFHNLVPSLNHYFGGDVRQIRTSILGGSLLTFFIYAVWLLLVQGVVPLEGEGGIRACYADGLEASHALSIHLQSTAIGAFAQGFALFAIITSFLTQGLSLAHFLADGLKKATSPAHVALALVPPVVLAFLDPTIFYKALSFGGGICAVILFGLIPIGMSWNGRPKHKLALLAALVFSLLILAMELKKL